MIINKKIEGTTITVNVEGRIDTTTASEFEEQVKSSLDQIENLQLDFEKLEYISSAGLRVLLSLQKMMNKQGKMEIHHVNETVYEVFDVTGFTDILSIV